MPDRKDAQSAQGWSHATGEPATSLTTANQAVIISYSQRSTGPGPGPCHWRNAGPMLLADDTQAVAVTADRCSSRYPQLRSASIGPVRARVSSAIASMPLLASHGSAEKPGQPIHGRCFVCDRDFSGERSTGAFRPGG